MASITKTLTWNTTEGNVDHYEIGISTSPTGTPTILVVTTDTNTSKTITYDDSTYNPAWIFIRAIADDGSASAWSDPISTDSLTFLFTAPHPLQYAYANDITDQLAGLTIPSGITTRMIDKACLEASRIIDELCERRFSPQTVVERYDGTGMSQLELKHYPITAINYVKVNDYSGINLLREYSSSDLELSDYEAGILNLKPIMIDDLDISWQASASLLYGHVFSKGKRNVQVSYQYGHMFYVEGETLELASTDTSSSSGITTRTYRAIHHNWATNNFSIYRNGTLLTTGYSVDAARGLVYVASGAADDTLTGYYYHTVPHSIELCAAKIAAINVLNQVAANTTGGITSFRNMNYQETYGAKPFSGIVDKLQGEVDKIIMNYKRYNFEVV